MASPPPENEGELRATYAGAKRRIAALELQIQNFVEAGSKRKCELTTSITQGRVICRLVSMFDFVEVLVDESDRRRAVATDIAEDHDEDTLDQNRTFKGFELLIRHVSNIEEKLLTMELDELAVYFRELRKGARAARGDDAANLKPAVVSWVLDLVLHPIVLLSPTNKSERGFEHDATGRLLCPIEYTWLDEKTRQNIRDGHPDFSITADSWPAFLYPNALGNVMEENVVLNTKTGTE